MNKLYITIAILVIAIAGCSPSTQEESTPNPRESTPTQEESTPDQQENPEWINQLIDKYKSEPVGNPQQSIWRYEYKGQIVYFVPAQCCDMFSTLYDANGSELCAPNGGFTGKGDGKCPDFVKERTDEKLVWEDPRPR